MCREKRSKKLSGQKKAMQDVRKREGGCLGWTIVMASFIVSFIQPGFSTSIGLLLPLIVSHFVASTFEASLTGSILSSIKSLRLIRVKHLAPWFLVPLRLGDPAALPSGQLT